MHRHLVSIVAIVALVLVACGTDEEEPDLTVDDTEQDVADEPEEPEEPTEPEEPDPAAEGDDPEPDPQPDPERVDAPCAEHEGGEPVAFIDVVAPVDGQRVAGEIAMVGCASVYEATVRYRLSDAAGEVLVDDFTTATAGGPELGEFRETIAVDATGELLLEVFWESPKDGGEEDLVEVEVISE